MLEPVGSGMGARPRAPLPFLRLAIRADDDTGLAKLLHAADHVGTAFGHTVPKADQHVAGLRHLVIPAHTGRLPEALPISAKELMLDGVFPGPAIAELIRAARAAGEDLRDAGALRCQRLAQELIVGERA